MHIYHLSYWQLGRERTSNSRMWPQLSANIFQTLQSLLIWNCLNLFRWHLTFVACPFQFVFRIYDVIRRRRFVVLCSLIYVFVRFEIRFSSGSNEVEYCLCLYNVLHNGDTLHYTIGKSKNISAYK